jgi:hypothetical protein
MTILNKLKVAANDVEMTITNKFKVAANDIELLSNTLTHNGKNIGGDHAHDGSPTAPTGPIAPTGGPV